MKIRVLGCSGAIAAGYKTTAFLVDEHILVDAGTGVGDLTLDELARIDHILVSHAHLDHVLSIPLLADSVLRLRERAGRPPIQVHALPETLDALRRHLFNGVIWPDFTRLPSAEAPVLCLHPIETGQRFEIGGRQVEVLSAVHTVPACGYAIEAGPESDHAHWVFTGDTGPNPALWKRLAQLKVRQLVIECAFSDDEHALAVISRHLSPAQLGQELEQLRQPVDVYITHIKPGEIGAVMASIGELSCRHRLHPLEAGQALTI